MASATRLDALALLPLLAACSSTPPPIESAPAAPASAAGGETKDRAATSRLRVDAIGVLNRLRKSLAAEAKHDSGLPADLDAQVFAYFDLLETKAAESYAEAKKTAKAAKDAKEASAHPQGAEKSEP